MKRKINQLLLHPLISGSVIMIIGSNGVNALNYVYHLIIGRMMGPVEYGELAALFSLFGLISMFPVAFSVVIIKFVSASKTDEQSMVVLEWFKKKFTVVSLILCGLLVLFASRISSFMNISDPSLIILVALCFGLSLFALLYRSTLQGLLAFGSCIISLGTETLVKLFASIVFVYLGFQVFGALLGLVLATIVGVLISRYLLFKRLKSVKPQRNVQSHQILIYALPVLFQSFAITSLSSADLFLVKHFFSAYDAGIYASVSTLGKIIFYGCGPIGAVMFPLISKRQSQGQRVIEVFLYSLVITIILAGGVLTLFAVLPHLIVNVSFTNKFIDGSGLLFWYGLFMTFFTVSSLIINYNLSVQRLRVVLIPVVMALTQGVSIWFFHADLFQVILTSIIACALMTILLGLFTIYYEYKRYSDHGKND